LALTASTTRAVEPKVREIKTLSICLRSLKFDERGAFSRRTFRVNKNLTAAFALPVGLLIARFFGCPLKRPDDCRAAPAKGE